MIGSPGRAVRRTTPSLPHEVEPVLDILERHFDTSLTGVYLHGSAVAGGLQPHSDVDLLAVVEHPMPADLRARLATELLVVSGRPGGQGKRPIELILFTRADLAAPVHPARAAFVYGEWLRTAYAADVPPPPSPDPEMTLVLAQARHEARRLIGPEVAGLLPKVSRAEIRRATADLLPTLVASMKGDERNVLLTLARMWRTLAIGDFVPKDAAARWAVPFLGGDAAAILDLAARGYLGHAETDWHRCRAEAERAAEDIRARVEALVAVGSNRDRSC